MIPLFKPFMPELPDLDTILKSGRLAYGDYTKQFEERLKSYFDTPYVIAINSFNLAVSVAITSLGISAGDSVIASPMACLASTQPYLASGLRIEWADVDPHSGTLCPKSVEEHITDKTKAIIHNHFCGYPGHIEEINAIGQKYGIPVIDDGIESLGSEYMGRKIGNCGTDVTIFSLTPVRFCNCIDGGIIIYKDKELYDKSLLIRDCGIDRSCFRDQLGEINPLCDIKLIGYSATMSNVNGYIGLKQMDCIETLLKKHRFQADKWDKFFQDNNAIMPICHDYCNPNYWVYGVLAEDKTKAIKNFRDMGYYASGVHIRNDIYSVFGDNKEHLPGVTEFNNSFVALPCGWWM